VIHLCGYSCQRRACVRWVRWIFQRQAGPARFQNQFVKRLVDAVDLFSAHHISAHALFNLVKPFVIGLFERFKGDQHIIMHSISAGHLGFEIIHS
jgi:hypothetical protein